MCMRNLFSAALCAAMVSVAASGAEEPAPSGDLARLQGQWTATFGPQNVVVVLTIKGTSAVLAFGRADGQSIESKGEIKIDEAARPQKTLDWVNFSIANGQTAAPNLAIYKLDGDTLTVCSGGIGGDRPTEFKAGEGNKPSLIVLSRD